MQKGRRRSLISLYLAYFADYLNWGVAIAFLTAYIATDATPFPVLLWGPQLSLGIGFACFPIGEVVGSPLLSDLSNWIGRKKVLIGGFWGSIFSMFLCALSLSIGNFTLFLIAQFLLGLFSGKQAAAQAAIGDIQRGTKGQKLVFLSVIGAIGWILGPFLGKILIEQPPLSQGGYVWPSLAAAAIYFFSLVSTQWFFIDTYEPANRSLSTGKFFKTIGDAFLISWKESVFFIFLINLLGWYLLIVSLSHFLIDRFHLSDTQIGTYSNYLTLCFAIGGGIGTIWILWRHRKKNILAWSLLAGSMGLFLFYHSDQIFELWTYLAIPAITEAWIYPVYQTVLSDHSSERNQGKIFGLVGATNGACQFIASLILTGITNTHSILIAALLFLTSGALLPALIRKKKKNGLSYPFQLQKNQEDS